MAPEDQLRLQHRDSPSRPVPVWAGAGRGVWRAFGSLKIVDSGKRIGTRILCAEGIPSSCRWQKKEEEEKKEKEKKRKENPSSVLCWVFFFLFF